MRLIDADALIKQFEWLELCRLSKNEIYQIIHESPTIEPSLKLDNISNEDIEKFKIIWQRATSKGLLTVNCNDCDGYEAGYSAGLKDAERPQGEWVRKEDVIQSIAKQYIEHNELVPVWLSIGDLKGGAE